MPDDITTIAPRVDGAALEAGDVVWLRSGGPPMTIEDPVADQHGEIGCAYFEGDVLFQVRLAPACLTRFGS